VQPTLLRQLPCLHEIRFRYADRIVRVGDLEWRLRDTGGGPSVLIMLPGSLGNADIFYLQLLHLASRARCIAIDYPGAQTAALADGLAALLDTLKLAWLLTSWLLAADLWFATPPADQSLILASTFRGVLRSAQPSATAAARHYMDVRTRHKRADDAYE
jgi:hypothetical protein